MVFRFAPTSSGSCPAATTMVGYDWFQVSSPVLQQTSDKNPVSGWFQATVATNGDGGSAQ
ncbi:hypothetical protein HanXRQr2_Chr05g0201641 [Helianthus annuus]|uniref:Uncharacterized protein n=2 Tax=Helianthus annuus TaxID=4232 RepID=A0A251URH6_HELAN|nr:hypothetical protein HanXRQr2_Chr05g0201641 [Helianthus annuus]